MPAIERILRAYLALRDRSRRKPSLQAYRRVGLAPFKAALYGRKARKMPRDSARTVRWPTGCRR